MSSWLAEFDAATDAQEDAIGIAPEQWQWHSDRAHFTAGVQRIKDLIAAGDLFQANHSVLQHPVASGTILPGSVPEAASALPCALAGLLIGDGDARKPCSPPHRNGFGRSTPVAASRHGQSKAHGRALKISGRMPTWQWI